MQDKGKLNNADLAALIREKLLETRCGVTYVDMSAAIYTETGCEVNATTLRSMLTRGGKLRLRNATIIAQFLGIDVDEIDTVKPMSASQEKRGKKSIEKIDKVAFFNRQAQAFIHQLAKSRVAA